MRVLSLFDGMSCGQIALERAGISVADYFASEVDKYAIKVTQANYPDTIQLGSIENQAEWDLPDIDLVIGGSPCQGFSFAGKQLNFDDPRSKLFFNFVEALNRFKPKYFLLENVKMKQEYQDVITRMLRGVKPIEINSQLVSAQNRRRLYWTNIPGIEQPEDRGILLKDIIERDIVDQDKSYCLDANYFKGGNLKSYFEKHRRQLVFKAKNGKNVVFNEDDIETPRTVYETRTEEGKKFRRECKKATGKDLTKRSPKHKQYVAQKHEKSNCLVTVDSELNNIIDSEYNYRKLTPLECERLQTVPDQYTNHVSNTQRYKMLGNGWTVDIIAHIFKAMEKDIYDV